MQALRFNENIRLTIEELHVSIFVIKLESDYAFFSFCLFVFVHIGLGHTGLKKTLAG